MASSDDDSSSTSSHSSAASSLSDAAIDDFNLVGADLTFSQDQRMRLLFVITSVELGFEYLVTKKLNRADLETKSEKRGWEQVASAFVNPEIIFQDSLLKKKEYKKIRLNTCSARNGTTLKGKWKKLNKDIEALFLLKNRSGSNNNNIQEVAKKKKNISYYITFAVEARGGLLSKVCKYIKSDVICEDGMDATNLAPSSSFLASQACSLSQEYIQSPPTSSSSQHSFILQNSVQLTPQEAMQTLHYMPQVAVPQPVKVKVEDPLIQHYTNKSKARNKRSSKKDVVELIETANKLNESFESFASESLALEKERLAFEKEMWAERKRHRLG